MAKLNKKPLPLCKIFIRKIYYPKIHLAIIDDDAFKGIESIIFSMTKEERSNPHILNGSRRKRIANGSGTSVQEVNQLIKQFSQMGKMMKMMQGGGAKQMMQMMQNRGGFPGMK